jgi:type 1 fimbria pilin
MKAIYFISFIVVSLTTFSQQQQIQQNVFVQNNINIPVQITQTTNHLNNDNNPFEQQQLNFIDDNISNINQSQRNINSNIQANDFASNNKKGLELSFNFSSRSSSSSSNKKMHKHTFHKKLTKFNRNLYGKMTLHKKSKHLVDVCFNWSK